MSDSPTRIYLDNAATSWPKPESVYRAVDDYQRQSGAPYGRGGYDSAMTVQSVVNQCRTRAAKLLGVAHPKRVIFTFNATDSLNMAIRGVLRHGEHVITSTLEHNSITRPLRELETAGQIEVSWIEPHQDGFLRADDFRDEIRGNTRLVGIAHASNVTGTIQPIEKIGQVAADAGAFFLVDAAQTAGVIPINFDSTGIDFLACAGHKSLLGPLGTGLLCLSPRAADSMTPFRCGGTGSVSESDTQPASLPDRFESGNHNVPGLFGLNAGLESVLTQGVDNIRKHELELARQFLEGVADIAGISVLGLSTTDGRVGVVSITSHSYDPQSLSLLLAQEFGIETRSGFHCAPGVHRWLGTLSTGGTVRFSFGFANTPQHVDTALDALRALHTSG